MDRDGAANGPALLLLNPHAGRNRPARLRAILAALPPSVRVMEPASAAEATRIARQAGATLVLAGGGDGTVAAVANGLAPGATLGVVPLGTANVFAHELGLPFTPAAITASLRAGHTGTIWPGRATGDHQRLFLQMAGVGFDAAVVHKLPPGLKRCLGRGAYVVQAVRMLRRYPFPPITLHLDDVAHAATSAIVTKGRLYGGRFQIAPDASPDHPGFTVVLAEGRRAACLLHAAALPLNLLPFMPGIRLMRAHSIRIETTHDVQLDGDAAGRTPLRITDAAPMRILLAAPKAF